VLGCTVRDGDDGEIGDALCEAFALVAGADPALAAIVSLSLAVSLAAVASALEIPVGALLAGGRFPGRGMLLDALLAPQRGALGAEPRALGSRRRPDRRRQYRGG
jgi:hypothetical protein